LRWWRWVTSWDGLVHSRPGAAREVLPQVAAIEQTAAFVGVTQVVSVERFVGRGHMTAQNLSGLSYTDQFSLLAIAGIR